MINSGDKIISLSGLLIEKRMILFGAPLRLVAGLFLEPAQNSESCEWVYL